MRIATPYKHPISGIYYFRRAVPEALRSRLNKAIVKVSLGTRKPNEALQLFAIRQVECEELFNAARNGCITSHHMTLLKTTCSSGNGQSAGRVTLQYLFERLNKEREVSKKTIDESQKVLTRFDGVYKDIDAEHINGTTIREFKELLVKTPSILSNELRVLTLVQIAKVIKTSHPGRLLSDSAINKHLSVISSILQWASNNSYFGDNWHNPVRGKTIHRKGLKQDRMPFTESDLSRMFSSDIYIKQVRPKGVVV